MSTLRVYVSPVAVNPATGFSSPAQLADNRPKRFFYVRRMASSFGRPCGEPSGSPVPIAGLLTRTVALPFSSGRAVFESLNWGFAMPRTKAAPTSAVVIPFPRFRRRKNAPPVAGFTTDDFDAGFEAAMAMIIALKRRGLLSTSLKGV